MHFRGKPDQVYEYYLPLQRYWSLFCEHDKQWHELPKVTFYLLALGISTDCIVARGKRENNNHHNSNNRYHILIEWTASCEERTHASLSSTPKRESSKLLWNSHVSVFFFFSPAASEFLATLDFLRLIYDSLARVRRLGLMIMYERQVFKGGRQILPCRGIYISYYIIYLGTRYIHISVSYTHLTLPTICSV